MDDDEDPRIRRLARWAWVAALVFSLLVAAIALAPRADPQGLPEGPLAVPSGQEVTLLDAFYETQEGDEVWLRLRFVAPRIGSGPGAVDFDVAEADMVHLCRTLGLAWAAAGGAVRIVVSLASAPVAFGQTEPDVTQFFEVYRPEGDDCIWEEF